MRVVLLTLFLTMCFISGFVYSGMKTEYQKDRNWKIKAVAPAGMFLLFSYSGKNEPEGKALQAIVIYESSTHYRLVGGVCIHKDIPKKGIGAIVAIPLAYQE